MRTALVVVALLVLAACPGKSQGPAPQPPGPVEDPDPADPENPPATTAPAELDGDRIVLPGALYFSDTTLDVDASAPALAALRDLLADRDEITLVRIEGHTDSDMTGEEAVMFSGERALQVGLWLQDQGIACERLLIAGFGEWKPIADNSTAEGKAQNRRVDIFVAELRGKAIGGMPVDGSAPAAMPACS